MVLGHNLHYMAPFGILRTGFCMVFQRASFVFSCPGTDFGAQDLIFGPGVNILARGPFLGQKWAPKKVNLRRNHFVVADQGKFPNPNEFYYI